jgi:hypothetical protein
VRELLPDQPVSINDRYVHKEVEAPKTADPVTAPPQPAGIAKIKDHHDVDDWQDGIGSDYDDGNLADDKGENDEYDHLVGTPDSESLLHGVNAKSEKFIKNFYERLKLERQRSIEEFDERLNISS